MLRHNGLQVFFIVVLSACAVSPQADRYLPAAEGQPATPDQLKSIQTISVEVKLDLPAKTPDAWAAETVKRLLTYSGYKVVSGKAPAKAVLRISGAALGGGYTAPGRSGYYYTGTLMQATLDLYPDDGHVSSIQYYGRKDPAFYTYLNNDMLDPQGAPFEKNFLSERDGFARLYFEQTRELLGEAPVLRAAADDSASPLLRRSAYELIGVWNLPEGYSWLKRAISLKRDGYEHYAAIAAIAKLNLPETQDVLLEYIRKNRNDPRYSTPAKRALGFLVERPPAGTVCELASLLAHYKVVHTLESDFADKAVAEGGPVCIAAFTGLQEVVKKDLALAAKYGDSNRMLQEKDSIIKDALQRMQRSE